MELSGCRPFALDAEACRFIARSLDLDTIELAPENLAEFATMRAASATRLLRNWRVGNAAKMATLGLVPQTLMWASTGALYWPKQPG